MHSLPLSFLPPSFTHTHTHTHSPHSLPSSLFPSHILPSPPLALPPPNTLPLTHTHTPNSSLHSLPLAHSHTYPIPSASRAFLSLLLAILRALHPPFLSFSHADSSSLLLGASVCIGGTRTAIEVEEEVEVEVGGGTGEKYGRVRGIEGGSREDKFG